MILAYEVGDRSGETAIEFMDNLRTRLANRVQLTTDGLRAYLEAVEGAFGGDVDYAQLVKLYGTGRWTRARARRGGIHQRNAPASSNGKWRAIPTRPPSALRMRSGRT